MDKEEVLQQALGGEVNLGDWRKKMRDGFLVSLKMKRWRARNKLTLRDLGISPSDYQTREAYEQLLTLGSKLLLPQDALKELDLIERLARQNLAQYTFKTPFGLFLPYTSYRLWKEANETCKMRFFAKRDEMVAAYPDLIQQILTEYEQIARHTYHLLCGQVKTLQEDFPEASHFINYYKSTLIYPNIKSSTEFYETFVYEEIFSRVQMADAAVEEESLSEDQAENVLTLREAEIQAAQKRKVMLEEMNRDLVRKTREQKQSMIDNFLASLVTQLRTLTYDACTSVLTSIKEQETLQGRPVIQLQKLVQQLQNMNFYGDQDIDRILTTLHGIIEKPAKERNLEDITRQLRAIATLSRGTILALGDEAPREGRELSAPELGISLYPDGEEMREAREEIVSAVTRYSLARETSREAREDRSMQRPVAIAAEQQREERE